MKYLGYKLKDKITGYTGIATGYLCILFGSEQYLITPEQLRDGDIQQGTWIATGRLEIMNDGIVPDLERDYSDNIINAINNILSNEATQ